MTAMPQSTDIHSQADGLEDGTLLLGDQFTITSQLSRGGFGITYLARDNTLDRTVVLKECFPENFCGRDGDHVHVRSAAHEGQYRSIVEMFMREARAIAKMRHPNIVGVHRVFEDNRTAYMALDLIDGRDLLEIIHDDDRDMTPTQVKEILIKVLDAVSLIHSKDLLHRDISPDNILINKWGNPVLIDFGAAREEASKNTRILSSVLVVKDGYSPQEFYFAGSTQNASSDLYSLGATFYHLISGEAPPNSQTRVAEVACQNGDPYEPLVGRFPDFDETFLTAIDKAMELSARDRHQAASEWLDMIDPLQKHSETYTRPAMNESLGFTLTSLVSDTNRDLLTVPPRDVKLRPIDELKKDNVIVADWVKEFNAEAKQDLKRDGLSEDDFSLDVGGTPPGYLSAPASEVIAQAAALEAAHANPPKKKGVDLKLVLAIALLLGGVFAVMAAPEAFGTFVGRIIG